MEENLKKPEETDRTMFEAANDAIFVHEIERGSFVDVNQRTLDLYGYSSKEEILGKFPGDLSSGISPYTGKEADVFARKAIQGFPQVFQWHARGKDGRLFWVEVNLKLAVISGEKRILATVRDIQDRKEIEERLEKNRRFLLESQNVARIGSYDLNLKTGACECSTEFRRIFGLPDTLVFSEAAWIERVHRKDREKVVEYYHELMSSGKKRFDKEYRIVLESIEKSLWIHGLGNFEYDPEGRPLRLVGTVQDISERKQAEYQIEMLAKFPEENPNPVLRISSGGQVIYCNRAGVPILNLFLDEPAEKRGEKGIAGPLPAKRFGKGIPISPKWRKTVKKIFQSGKNQGIEVTCGNQAFILNLTPNQVAGYVNVYGLDITERKQAELELQRAKQAAESAKKALSGALNEIRTIINVIPDMVYQCNPEGELLKWNLRLRELTGRSDEELEFLRVRDLFSQQDAAYVEKQILEVRERGRSAFEADIQTLAGERIPYYFSVVALRDEAGNVTGFTGTGRNIAAQKQTEDALIRTAKSAEAASQAKSAFLANMSHELRTPLNAIIGFAQLLSRDATLSPKNLEHLGIILRSGEHLLTLINSVLEMSKIEAGRSEIQYSVFHLDRMLDGLWEMMNLRATRKGLQLRFEINPQTPKIIESDEGKLRQILINLLENAVKFTRTGTVTLSVVSETTGQEHHGATFFQLLITVKDTGPGIGAEEQKSLFTPFSQALDTEKTTDGTGLGLSICRQYAELLGGSIQVESCPGKGSAFSIRIPVLSRTGTTVSRPERLPRVIGLTPGQAPPDGGQWRTLIVDDNRENRALMRQILKPLHFEIREAKNGRDAVSIQRTWRPHLIWMDVRMPVLDGNKATEEIRSQVARERLLPTPVILALTASAFDEQKEISLATGSDGVLTKPFRESEIFGSMAKHLNLKYVYQESASPEESSERGQGAENLPCPPRLSDRLARVPTGLLHRLQEGAELGDITALGQIIDELSLENPSLGETLKHLAGDFAYEEILQAVREVKSRTG